MVGILTNIKTQHVFSLRQLITILSITNITYNNCSDLTYLFKLASKIFTFHLANKRKYMSLITKQNKEFKMIY